LHKAIISILTKGYNSEGKDTNIKVFVYSKEGNTNITFLKKQSSYKSDLTWI